MYIILKLPLAAVESAYPLKNSVCIPIVLMESPPRTLVEADESKLESRHANQIENNSLEIFFSKESCRAWIEANVEAPSMLKRASNFIQGLFS